MTEAKPLHPAVRDLVHVIAERAVDEFLAEPAPEPREVLTQEGLAFLLQRREARQEAVHG